MPFPDENIAIVIDVDFGMPRQAVVAAVNLIRLAVFVEGRQVHASDRGCIGGIAASLARFHGVSVAVKDGHRVADRAGLGVGAVEHGDIRQPELVVVMPVRPLSSECRS